ncbi:MAG: 2-hydroxyglutaryl-CoA dehydratase [Deltaproteobacteria bacterium]|nr:2-hydroxyglutaryl-CoA dehydratase [Candidatus Anaeroferrophillus wilburensis]MBN2889824.1 2-hydroxyglutaryl-CoA dehydratase [Deltaproteobacteria bacterium]
MDEFFCGIDIGSLSCEAVLVDAAGVIRGWQEMATRPNHLQTAREILDRLLTATGLDEGRIAAVVGTGYGRRNIPFADHQVTEISCHARGAAACFPAVDMLIDIGGQDSKVIHVDGTGMVLDFAMNDKCAAGTGKFLNVMAQTLQLSLSDLGPVSLQARKGTEISSMCTVFAESEVISLIAAGEPVAEIAWGVHLAMARRVASMAKQLGLKGRPAFTGGVALNAGMIKALEIALGVALLVPEVPQIVGAYGAALLARDRFMDEKP